MNNKAIRWLLGLYYDNNHNEKVLKITVFRNHAIQRWNGNLFDKLQLEDSTRTLKFCEYLIQHTRRWKWAISEKCLENYIHVKTSQNELKKHLKCQAYKNNTQSIAHIKDEIPGVMSDIEP